MYMQGFWTIGVIVPQVLRNLYLDCVELVLYYGDMWLRLILTHKNLIIKAYWVVLLLGVVGLTWMVQKQYILVWLSIGSLAAKTAVISYLLTLVPGILKRFEIQTLLQPIHLPLMTFRRQIGIFSFLSAFYHFVFSFALLRWPKLNLLIPTQFEDLLGWVALHFLLVLFITSNDWAVKNLGVWWHKIHNLTHVIIWMLLTHVVLKMGMSWVSILIAVIGGANVLSFGYMYMRKSRQEVKAGA